MSTNKGQQLLQQAGIHDMKSVSGTQKNIRFTKSGVMYLVSQVNNKSLRINKP